MAADHVHSFLRTRLAHLTPHLTLDLSSGIPEAPPEPTKAASRGERHPDHLSPLPASCLAHWAPLGRPGPLAFPAPLVPVPSAARGILPEGELIPQTSQRCPTTCTAPLPARCGRPSLPEPVAPHGGLSSAVGTQGRACGGQSSGGGCGGAPGGAGRSGGDAGWVSSGPTCVEGEEGVLARQSRGVERWRGS